MDSELSYLSILIKNHFNETAFQRWVNQGFDDRFLFYFEGSEGWYGGVYGGKDQGLQSQF